MEKIKLEFYQRIYKYALTIVRFSEQLPKGQAVNVLAKQLVRSGTSVTANLIESKSASSKRDYINYYNHALKSANETKLWLALIRDSYPSNSQVAKEIMKETVELSNIIAASILTMKKKR